MNQLTLRKIPASLDRRLRQCARQNGQSLNKIVVLLISQALGLTGPKRSKHRRDLSRFAGVLNENQVKEFEANTRAFETIDKAVWK